MAEIRIGSYQGPVAEGDLAAGLAVVRREMAWWPALHFLCFPECFLGGYGAEAIAACAITRDDPRLLSLAAETGDTVILVGFSERKADGIYNAVAVLWRGALLGIAYKTMLTEYDALYFRPTLEIPVFTAHGLRFGAAVCHTTSYPEPALYLRLCGARLLFTPRYNSIPPAGRSITFAEHRTMVLNNQAALATLLKMVVVRSNIIRVAPDGLGAGDSNIWDMNGKLAAAGEPFVEQVVTAAFDEAVFHDVHFIDRGEVPLALYRMIEQAARENEALRR